MAEARVGTDGLTSTIRNVDLKHDDYGLHYDIRISIPRPRMFGKILNRQLRRFGRFLLSLLYPRGVLLTAFFSVALMILVLLSAEDAWVRSGWVAEIAWSLAGLFPWLEVPRNVRIAIVTFNTGFVLSLILAILERIILKQLLSFTGWIYLPRKQTPLKWKVWGFFVKVLGGGIGPKWALPAPLLYGYKRVLPTLPLPKVHSTVEKYLASVKGLQTAEEFAQTEALAAEFLEKEGPTLQWYLSLKWWFSTNYISDWWEKYVYLRGRTPLNINSNYYCLDGPLAGPPTSLQTARAAVIVYEMLKYKKLQDSESLLPIKARGLFPLCMEQHLRMFSTARVPGRESDKIVHYPADSSHHIVVLCKGSYYKLSVVTKGGLGRTLLPTEIEQCLEAIQADAVQEEIRRKFEISKLQLPQHSAAHVAALTTMGRTEWATARETWFAQGMNKEALRTVESAILMLVLDDTSPVTLSERSHSLLAGSGPDRWFDKSLCLVAFSNGKMGMNSEHTWADALVVAHLWEVVFSGTTTHDRIGYAEDGHCVNPAKYSGATLLKEPAMAFSRVEWDIRSPSLAKTIESAMQGAQEAAADVDLYVTDFTEFGADAIKKMGISPDSFIQMALQLAYYRDQNKKFGLTYEASMVRFFRHGRTETIRSLSEDSVAFVKAMCHNDAASTREEAKQLLQTAVLTHSICAKDALTGRGADRHLFGLYVVAEGKGIESPFLKGALSAPWVLSTSQQPQRQQPHLWNPSTNEDDHARQAAGGGFGPVADDGYGVSYMISAGDAFFFHVSSKHAQPNTSSARFVAAIFKALCDMRDLFAGESSEVTEGGKKEGKKTA